MDGDARSRACVARLAWEQQRVGINASGGRHCIRAQYLLCADASYGLLRPTSWRREYDFENSTGEERGWKSRWRGKSISQHACWGDKKTNWKDTTVKTAETPNFVSSAGKNSPQSGSTPTDKWQRSLLIFRVQNESIVRVPAVPYRLDQQHFRNIWETSLNFATRLAKRLLRPASHVPEIPNSGMISIVLGKLRTKTKCIRRRQEGDEDRRARSLKRTLKAKDRRLRDIQRVQEITSVVAIDAGVGGVKMRQSSTISGRRRAGLPRQEWSRADHGGMLGTRGGRTP